MRLTCKHDRHNTSRRVHVSEQGSYCPAQYLGFVVRIPAMPMTVNELATHHGHVAKTANDQEREEQKEDQQDDGKPPVSVVVHACCRDLIARANWFFDMLKA